MEGSIQRCRLEAVVVSVATGVGCQNLDGAGGHRQQFQPRCIVDHTRRTASSSTVAAAANCRWWARRIECLSLNAGRSAPSPRRRWADPVPSPARHSRRRRARCPCTPRVAARRAATAPNTKADACARRSGHQAAPDRSRGGNGSMRIRVKLITDSGVKPITDSGANWSPVGAKRRGWDYELR